MIDICTGILYKKAIYDNGIIEMEEESNIYTNNTNLENITETLIYPMINDG
jgi:hypothetical protein